MTPELTDPSHFETEIGRWNYNRNGREVVATLFDDGARASVTLRRHDFGEVSRFSWRFLPHEIGPAIEALMYAKAQLDANRAARARGER